MSLPRELHEQLLSAYLDDALSGDERVRIEEILARDPAARDDLQRMRRLQRDTRQLMTAVPAGGTRRSLDDRFADRVMKAAFAEAGRTLSPKHPLRRAAERAAASRADPSRIGRSWTGSWRRSAVAVIALAAALLLAVTLFQFPLPIGDQAGAPGPAVAERNRSGGLAPAIDETRSQQDLAVAERSGVARRGSEPSAERESPSITGGEARPADAIAALDGDDRSMNERSTAADSQPLRPPSDRIASAPGGARADRGAPNRPSVDRPAGNETNGSAAGTNPAAVGTPLNMVMVLQIERTELGRSNEVVAQALRQADIRSNVRRTVDQQVVGYLREAKMIGQSEGDDAGSPLSILFIEAPGKQLDRFMVALFQQYDQIAGIGLNLAADPPLVAAASQLSQVDPSQVQHAADTATAWQLVQGDDRASFPAPREGRNFLPINAEMAGAGLVGGVPAATGSSADQGPDITGRLLVVIR